jgi:hypothetical protein
LGCLSCSCLVVVEGTTTATKAWVVAMKYVDSFPTDISTLNKICHVDIQTEMLDRLMIDRLLPLLPYTLSQKVQRTSTVSTLKLFFGMK